MLPHLRSISAKSTVRTVIATRGLTFRCRAKRQRPAPIHIGPNIAAGRLVSVLKALNPGDREEIHAGQAGPMPGRVQVFIDHLVKAIRLG